jgi:hypothetical protein
MSANIGVYLILWLPSSYISQTRRSKKKKKKKKKSRVQLSMCTIHMNENRPFSDQHVLFICFPYNKLMRTNEEQEESQSCISISLILIPTLRPAESSDLHFQVHEYMSPLKNRRLFWRVTYVPTPSRTFPVNPSIHPSHFHVDHGDQEVDRVLT